MKKIFTIITLFTILIATASFTNNNSKNQSPKKVKVSKVNKAKKHPKKQNAEITETKIEITPEYQKLMDEDMITETPVATQQQPTQVNQMKVATTTENPNKVHYFIKSKESPNLYEIK